jgi:hypothetical protein
MNHKDYVGFFYKEKQGSLPGSIFIESETTSSGFNSNI